MIPESLWVMPERVWEDNFFFTNPRVSMSASHAASKRGALSSHLMDENKMLPSKKKQLKAKTPTDPINQATEEKREQGTTNQKDGDKGVPATEDAEVLKMTPAAEEKNKDEVEEEDDDGQEEQEAEGAAQEEEEEEEVEDEQSQKKKKKTSSSSSNKKSSSRQ